MDVIEISEKREESIFKLDCYRYMETINGRVLEYGKTNFVNYVSELVGQKEDHFRSFYHSNIYSTRNKNNAFYKYVKKVDRWDKVGRPKRQGNLPISFHSKRLATMLYVLDYRKNGMLVEMLEDKFPQFDFDKRFEIK